MRYFVAALQHGRIPCGIWSSDWTPILMPEEIANANIAHFKKLLETETDAERRAAIERLLAEEEELKVAALRNARTERNKKR
ncbi:hypothetical protein AAFG13_23250 [Bradyrhizobium sp. B124]|uniref:hypothetical protein n=1 Tax=Bradyrhizobium sp. B124 TaxID=3140245 RepID=UPI0031833E8F